MSAELVAAIRAAPDDDRPRLIYADFLEQQGDPRGEFIAIQCRLAQARLEYDEVLAKKLAKREGEILGAGNEYHWTEELRSTLRRATKFRRGFTEVALLEDARELLPHTAMLRNHAPLLRAIEAHGPIGAVGHPDLVQIDEVIAHKAFHRDDLAQIASSKASRLTSLVTLGNGMSDAALVALVELPQPLARLELGIDGRPTRRISILPRLVHRHGLRDLTIRMPASYDDVADAIAPLDLEALGLVAGDPSAKSFERLIMSTPKLRRLELREAIGWKLDLSILRELPELRSLRLNKMQLTDEQLIGLAPYLTNLVELDVRANGLTGAGILAVCEHATSLRRLLIAGNSMNAATKTALKSARKHLHVAQK